MAGQATQAGRQDPRPRAPPRAAECQGGDEITITGRHRNRRPPLRSPRGFSGRTGAGRERTVFAEDARRQPPTG